MSKFQKGLGGSEGLSGGSRGHGHGGMEGGLGGGAGAEVFSFTVANGSVTGGSLALRSGTTVTLPTASGVSYSLSGSDVVATRTGTQSTDTVRYSDADADADGLYAVVASSKVLTTAPEVNMLGFSKREALTVTLDTAGTGVATVTQKHWNGTEKLLLSSTVTPANTTWTLQQGLLVEVNTRASGETHWEIFRDGNADGVYTEVASGTGALVDLVGVLTATQAVAASL